jgi:hypothetical protein
VPRHRGEKLNLAADDETITVRIPLTFRKRGGRKLVVTPDGAEWAPRPRVDNAMVKALARAFRWRKMLDEGVHATLEDLARAKGVASSYMSRVLRLTLQAPELVEMICPLNLLSVLFMERRNGPWDEDRQRWSRGHGMPIPSWRRAG